MPPPMPITSAIEKAAEQVRDDRAAVAGHVCSYAASDLLCYRADAPPGLRDRQQAVWQPLLDWAAETFGAALNVTEGVIPVEQPAAALSLLRKAVDALDDRSLAALAVAARASGSLIIGLALIKGRIGVDAALEASELDHRWQNKKWGEDPETKKRQDALRDEIQASADSLQLVGGGEGP